MAAYQQQLDSSNGKWLSKPKPHFMRRAALAIKLASLSGHTAMSLDYTLVWWLVPTRIWVLRPRPFF